MPKLTFLYFLLYFFRFILPINTAFFSIFEKIIVNNCTFVALFVFLSLLLRYEKYVQSYGVGHHWAVRRFSHQIGNYMTDSKKMYKDWEILDEIPEGWVIDNTAGSPAPNTVFIRENKSVLNGQKRALLRVEKVRTDFVAKPHHVEIKEESQPFTFPAKTVNVLARQKFKEQILKEIMFDLMVCEVEGWDKNEYIQEIKILINSINLDGTN